MTGFGRDVQGRDTGAAYLAREGRVYARLDGEEREAGTALSANGRELERHDRALQLARQQRERSTS